MKKALFLDFEDSFTFNVVQELEEVGFRVEVIPWKNFSGNEIFDLLILGPGPGHPDEYEEIFSLIKDYLNSNRPFLGICLGHQIFWRIQGAKVERSQNPMHGQKVLLRLDQHWRDFLQLKNDPWVQRYNSLCVRGESSCLNKAVENFIQQEEILISKSKTILTYQFHPESIGTTYPQAFFGPLLREFV